MFFIRNLPTFVAPTGAHQFPIASAEKIERLRAPRLPREEWNSRRASGRPRPWNQWPDDIYPLVNIWKKLPTNGTPKWRIRWNQGDSLRLPSFESLKSKGPGSMSCQDVDRSFRSFTGDDQLPLSSPGRCNKESRHHHCRESRARALTGTVSGRSQGLRNWICEMLFRY